MKKILTFTAAFGMLMLMNSCASLTGFEEGRTLGESNSEFGVSLNYGVAPDLFADDSDITETISFPNVELNYKYGVTEKLDVGSKVSTNLNFGIYTKYQLVGDRTSSFALSPGLELATFAGLGYAVHVPIYTSIYPSDKVTINLNPRFVYQFANGDALDAVNYIGGNAGFLFGKKHKFGIDFGFYTVGLDGSRETLLTFGVGGRFRFGDNLASGSSSDSDDSRSRRRRR